MTTTSTTPNTPTLIHNSFSICHTFFDNIPAYMDVIFRVDGEQQIYSRDHNADLFERVGSEETKTAVEMTAFAVDKYWRTFDGRDNWIVWNSHKLIREWLENVSHLRVWTDVTIQMDYTYTPAGWTPYAKPHALGGIVGSIFLAVLTTEQMAEALSTQGVVWAEVL